MDALVTADLKGRFGDRVTFDKAERLIYGHDVASLPEAVEMLIDNVPEAVVQPRSVEEVQFLVNLSRKHSIPLVPRGAATTGYGGAVPAKGGIVVDMSWMKRVLDIDTLSGTVTVEPGVVWGRLEDELIRHGQMLRLYPTSAPGSTVAGWVAEGGAGIGSYEYGFIGQNLTSITIVTPEGELRKLTGADLELANRAEGITGFIVEVTLLTRPLEDQNILAAAFARLEDLSAAMADIKKQGLPLWHVSVSTAEFVRSKEEALALGQNGNGHGNGHGTVGHTVAVPKGRHLATLVYPASRSGAVDERLAAILKAHGAEIQSDQVANHEWAERFYPMRMKRLGPSLVPSEGILPVSSLPKVVAEASRKLQGIAIEGHLVGPDEITLLCFLLEDERTGSYMIGFSKSLTMLGIIERNGGRPYSVGLYFTDQAESALGKDKISRISAYKKQHDPNNLMNPGKILSDTGNPVMIRTAMAAAKVAEPVMGLAEKLLGDRVHVKKNLAENLAFDAFACAQCGYCRDVCTLYNGKFWESSSPRGKWFFLRKYAQGKVEFDQKMVDNFLQCTTCKRCDAVCQVNIPIQGRWDDMRKLLVYEQHHQTFPAFEMMGASFESELNIWAAEREERDAWFPKDATYEEKAEIGYWAGCTASFVESDIAENAVHILKEGGVKFTYLAKDEACCGVPFLTAGKVEDFEMAMRHNVEQLKAHGVKKLVISCPGCWVAFNHYYRHWAPEFGIDYELEPVHISEITAGLIKDGKLHFKKEIPQKLTWHDPCHIGRHGGIFEAPREVIKAIPGVEYQDMAHNRENGLCCGSVLTRISDPVVSNRIAHDRVAEGIDIGADAILTTCPCCEVQLRVGAKKNGQDIPILDFTDVVADALGYEVKDSRDNVQYMWGVFEKAIAAMTVEGMVEMMGQMMPEMMQAMPGAMQKAMDGVASMPGVIQEPALAAMEKMMPSMMPSMLPGMMPKLMPKVLDLMKQLIPDMPPAMEEMLPDLMPKVMAKIMPPMVPEAAPKIAPIMTNYLRNKR